MRRNNASTSHETKARRRTKTPLCTTYAALNLRHEPKTCPQEENRGEGLPGDVSLYEVEDGKSSTKLCKPKVWMTTQHQQAAANTRKEGKDSDSPHMSQTVEQNQQNGFVPLRLNCALNFPSH